MQQIVTFVSSLLPAISIAAAAVAVFIYVRYRGTIDALRDVAETYESLAAGYKEKIDALEDQLAECARKIERMESELEGQKTALGMAIDELIAGFERAGLERKS